MVCGFYQVSHYTIVPAGLGLTKIDTTLAQPSHYLGILGIQTSSLPTNHRCVFQQPVRLLKEEFGFDEAFNYKADTDWDAVLSRYFPKGIDIYFDNVGGRMLEAALNHININARIPLCGMISQYNEEWKQRYGVRNLLNLVGKCAKMQGFMMAHYLNRMKEFTEEMAVYVKEGKIKYREDVREGMESFLDAFNSMFRGGNIGKTLIRLSPA
eukprot:Gb_23108 [translate_table: standard]